MDYNFGFSEFLLRFPDDDSCLEEIKRLRFPRGITCSTCGRITIHYKIKNRNAYSCKYCRHQSFPLAGTVFEKTTTPLRIWFYAIFLMTYTRGNISIKQLEGELGVTYKTAWRIYTNLRTLMAMNDGDLLKEPVENSLFKWTFFNKFEIKVVEKERS